MRLPTCRVKPSKTSSKNTHHLLVNDLVINTSEKCNLNSNSNYLLQQVV